MLYRPKKRLGQNFLVDKNVRRKIIDCCQFTSRDTVLEIGAGRGELTALIAARVKKIYCLELDSRLCDCIRQEFADITNLEVINQDVLKFNLKKYFKPGPKVKVVGNIPYYISTPIIEHLLKFSQLIDAIYLTVQKEFAQRLCAGPGSKIYGALSLFLQYHTEPKILFVVSKNSFFPRPKVDSAFVRLKIRTVDPVEVNDEKLLFQIIRTSFNYRRKTLRNSLSEVIPPSKLEDYFCSFNIDKDIRPEELSLKDFANLANLKNKQKNG